MSRGARLEIRSFSDDVLDDAARLLSGRHRDHRRAEPGLAAIFENETATRTEIGALARKEGASGAVALRGDEVVGFLVGAPRAPMWGPNIWVEAAGHAVAEPEIVRDLYGFAASRWVEQGSTSHYIVVPATDPVLVAAWFGSGFGQQHVHAIREVPGPDEIGRPPDGIVVRQALLVDIPALAALEVELPAHQTRSPVFSSLAPPGLEATIGEWEADFDDPRFHVVVAEHGGRVIGSAVGCSIVESSGHHGLARPPDAGYLAFAAVFPEARGLGAGRALGEAVLAWARDAGYATVVTDWRQTNLLSSRTWPRLGFRPTFRRLHRAIA